MLYKRLSPFLLAFLICIQSFAQKKLSANDRKIEVIFLQVNDVYEISPLDHGNAGGISRLATVRKELLQYNPRTYTVIAGDFVSPSAIGTILLDTAARKKIAGMHMIESFNGAGIDLATFGNHEFDISANELSEAINRSSFEWVSSNVRHNDSSGLRRYSKLKNGKNVSIPEYRVLSFKDAKGNSVKIGVFGLTLETPGKKRNEAYDDYYLSADKAIKALKGKCDFIVALTHLEIGMDRELARRFPEIKLILGGHEHINSYERSGKTIIAKADANARTAYIHSLKYDTRRKTLDVKSRLLVINNAIESDSATQNIVDNWNHKAHDILSRQGFDPCEILDSLSEPLDGRELVIRTEPTNLGELIGESMSEALAIHTDCAIYNSGSIRVDDVLSGYITQYDMFRVLPFENKILVKELSGQVIDSLLRTNPGRKHDGSFLQYSGISRKDTMFYINGKMLYHDTTRYKVAMNYYLAMGFQAGLNFIGSIAPAADQSPPLTISNNDMRKALIEKFRRKYRNGPKSWPVSSKQVPCY